MQRFMAVRLKPGHDENVNWLDGTDLAWNGRYAVLGEYGTSKHYIILDMTTGQILRGMFHLDRFEEIPEDDL